MTNPGTAPNTSTARIRLAAIGFSLILSVGTLAELTILKHWGGVQTIPWVVVGGTVVVALIAAFQHTHATTLLSRMWALVAMIGAGIGTYHHLNTNLKLGPTSPTLGDTWESMSTVSRMWAALTSQVGYTPVLVAGTAALGALALLVSTAADPLRLSPAENKD